MWLESEGAGVMLCASQLDKETPGQLSTEALPAAFGDLGIHPATAMQLRITPALLQLLQEAAQDDRLTQVRCRSSCTVLHFWRGFIDRMNTRCFLARCRSSGRRRRRQRVRPAAPAAQ